MANQSYGGSGLFGQPSFGDYSGLSGGVPEPMTPKEIQYQLLKQPIPDYQNVMDMYFGTPNTSSFNANVNSRPTSRQLLMNSYLYPNFLPPVSSGDNIQVKPIQPVEAVNQISVTNDSNANLPPAPKGKMWEFDANSNKYVLVDDPLSNLSQDASQTAPVASAQQVAMPAPAQSSIVQGMFPEVDAMQRALYQQKQNEAMQAQALQFAKLDPFQKASYGLAMGGQQLGDAIGGALGAKDPQMQMISLQSRILSELDPSDPAQQLQVAQKYAQVAPDLAMKIADNARSSLVKIAQANKERQTSVAPRVQESQRAGIITSAIRQYKALPQTPEVVQAIETLQSELDFLKPKAEATPDKIQVAERIARNKGFTQGSEEFNKEVAKQLERPEKDTPIEQLQSYRDQLINSKAPASKIAEVDAVIKSLGEGTAPKIIMPGQPVAPKDWLAFISQISKDPVMDRTSTVISDAPSAIETIRMSTTNDIAAASLPGALARLTGEGKNMSDRDIARYARTGGLTDRVAQDVVGFFTGQRTSVTKEQAERFATAVYRGALLERKKFIQDQAEQAGYKDTPNYAIAIRQLDDQLAKFKLIKPSEKAKESLTNPTVEFDTDKEKRYQEWKNKQGGAPK